MTARRIFTYLVLISFFISCNSGKPDSNKIASSIQSKAIDDTFKVFIENYPNGYLKKKTEAVKMKKDGIYKWIPHGTQWKYYAKNGNLMSIETYVLGRREGISTYYYGDGQKKYKEIPYINSKKEGIVKKYYRSGRLQSRTPYKGNVLGTGSQDYADRDVDAILTMPTLRVWADDQRRSNGTYTIYAKVIDKYGRNVKRVKFLEGMLLSAEGRKYEHPGLKQIQSNDGICSISYNELSGIPEFVSISARITTLKGTSVLLNKVHISN